VSKSEAGLGAQPRGRGHHQQPENPLQPLGGQGTEAKPAPQQHAHPAGAIHRRGQPGRKNQQWAGRIQRPVYRAAIGSCRPARRETRGEGGEDKRPHGLCPLLASAGVSSGSGLCSWLTRGPLKKRRSTELRPPYSSRICWRATGKRERIALLARHPEQAGSC